jgi:FkbM family methyltransferase
MPKLNFLSLFAWRFSFLVDHPAFRRNPYLLLQRIIIWEVFKLLKRNPKINIHNHSVMSLNPGPKRGIHGFIYIFRDDYECDVRFPMQNFVHENSICYDIGANIGYWTLYLSEIVGSSGRVYAFEPMSKNLKLLQKNIKDSDISHIVEIVPIGLGNRKGNLKIYIPLDPGSASIAPESDNDSFEEILVETIDEIWKSHGYPKVDFVKMDIEGSEPFVLEGGHQFFSELRPVVVCEANSRKLEPLDRTCNEIFEMFNSWNYDAFIFDFKLGKLVPCKQVQDGNIVFIPK